jgi:hypothetical protein
MAAKKKAAKTTKPKKASQAERLLEVAKQKAKGGAGFARDMGTFTLNQNARKATKMK